MLLGQTDAEAIHRETKVKGVSYGVSAVEISADARYLASIGEDGKLAVMFLGEELLNGGGSGAGSGENGDHPKSDTPQPRTWLCLDPDSADGSKDSTELSPTHDAALHHLVIGRGSEVLVAVGSRGRVVLVELPTRRVHEFSVGDDHTLLFSALDQVPRDNSSARLAVASTQVRRHCRCTFLLAHALGLSEQCTGMLPNITPSGYHVIYISDTTDTIFRRSFDAECVN
jgi:hypothetical protein